MSELNRQLVADVERLARRYGGTTFVRAAIDKTLDPDQRRRVLQHLLDAGVSLEGSQVDRDAYKLAWENGALQAALATMRNLNLDQRRSLLGELLQDGVTLPSGTKVTQEAEDPAAPSYDRFQALRGAVHALTRNHSPNLVVDAAMLEMPEEQREQVARAFLPKKSFREKIAEKTAGSEPKYTWVDTNGNVLHQADNTQVNFLIRDDHDVVTRYQLIETISELGPDGSVRMLARYSEVVAK